MNVSETTCYVVIEGKKPYDFSTWVKTRAKRMTAKKPSLGPNEIAVKITLTIPGEAFEQVMAEAVVNVPDALVQHPVTVEAVDPDE